MSLARFQHLAQVFDPGARRLRGELGVVCRELPRAHTILDLGSGEAPYKSLVPHERYVTADLFARADVRCDATRLPFRAGAFDLVLCTEVLEHVPDPDHTMEEIRRVIVNGGTLILTTPLVWGVHGPLDYQRWAALGLKRLLTTQGFTVEQMRPRGGLLLALAALVLVLPWQVLGEARERSAWQTALFAVAYPLLLIPAWLLAALDPLDRREHFTLGYVVRARAGDA